MRRRGVIHVAGLYVVAAWVLVQLADLMSGPFPLPDEALRLIWTALGLGFPIALVFGWRYDITRNGIVRTDPRSGDDEDLPLRRADYGIIATLSLVAAGIVGLTAVEVVTAVKTESLAVDTNQPDEPPAPNTIAVLPFVSCDNDPSNEVLGAAIAAELIGWLAEDAGLKVIARASSFAFRNSGYEIRQISRPLSVAHLLTGTLCLQNGSLLLDVELVDPQGFVVAREAFTQPNDPDLPPAGMLTATVAEWVSARLGSAGPLVVARACDNMDAYQQHIVGREYLSLGEFDEAQKAFARALEREPDCADAVAGLAQAKVSWRGAPPVDQASILEAQETVARRAVEMAPESEFAAAVLAGILRRRENDDEAERLLREALARMPRSALLNTRLAALLADHERYEEAETVARRALSLDPSSADARIWLGVVAGRQNRMAERIQILNDGIARDPLNLELLNNLGWAHYGQGQYHRSMRAFEPMRALPNFPPDAWRDQFMITLWSGRIDKAIELAIDMLENGGDDLKVDYVRRELCFAGVTLGSQLGLHEEMNRWMEHMDRVEGMADTFNEFNIYRLHVLGEHEAAVRLGHEWLESLGGASDGCNVATFTVLKTLVWAGEYQAAINLIEQIGDGDGECEEFMQFWLAVALRGMGREEEAFPIIERLVLADIPDLENKIYGGGWRPPPEIAELAFGYALAGRTDKALDTLEMAVDEHYRMLIREDDLFVAWKALYENPRFQELEQIIADDLDRQAGRVKSMLAERDLDALFAQMYDKP